MKAFSVFVGIAIVASAVFALQNFRVASVDGKTSPELKAIEENVVNYMKAVFDGDNERLRNDEIDAARGPAINWTWNNWADGPACDDITKFALSDLSAETEKRISDGMDYILDLYIKKLLEQKLDCGIGLGITYNGRNIYMGTAGTAKMGTTEKPTPDTVVSIGSISKIFTSLMMNVLAEQDALDISDPLTKYFNKDTPPIFNPLNPYDNETGTDAVTLESLASQTSGLCRESQCLLNNTCSEEEAVTKGNFIPLYHPPMTRPHYSNFGFSLLGHACERAASKKSGSKVKYEDWVKDNILTPFDMKLSGFDYPESIKKLMAEGYTFENGAQVLDPSFATTLGWSNPAGGMYSSLRDMLKFTTALTEMSGVLSPNGYERYFLPGAPLPDGVSSYGKSGWEVAYSNGFRVLTKGGLYAGFGTTVALIPQLKLGMFTWFNFDASSVPSQLSAYAMNGVSSLVKSEVMQHIAKHKVPSYANDLVGNYIYTPTQTPVFFFKKSAQTEHTGIYYGSIASSALLFFYDEQSSKTLNDNNACFFRFRSAPEDGNSCFSDCSAGLDDSLVLFKYDESTKRWTASIPELALYNLVGPEAPPPPPPPSSSSTTQSSSSHHHQSGSGSAGAASALTINSLLLAFLVLIYLL